MPAASRRGGPKQPAREGPRLWALGRGAQSRPSALPSPAAPGAGRKAPRQQPGNGGRGSLASPPLPPGTKRSAISPWETFRRGCERAPSRGAALGSPPRLLALGPSPPTAGPRKTFSSGRFLTRSASGLIQPCSACQARCYAAGGAAVDARTSASDAFRVWGDSGLSCFRKGLFCPSF